MGLDLVDSPDESGVLVISAWRESPGSPLVLRITTSCGDTEEATVVTSSANGVDAVVARWLLQFEGSPTLLR